MLGTERARPLARDVPAGAARPADGVLRHRRGDPGHQRGASRSLPVEALGSAGGTPLPGRRRPARRRGRPSPCPRRRACAWSDTSGRRDRTRSRTSWRATSSRIAGSTSSGTPRRGRCSRRRASPTDALPALFFEDGTRAAQPGAAPGGRAPRPAAVGRLRRLRPRDRRRRARPASRPRCTARRKGCGRCCSIATRPGGQAGTSSRIENYLGFPDGRQRQRADAPRRRRRRSGSAPSSSRRSR